MSRAWLIDVLDRELPHMTGGERDRVAEAILDALPTKDIATQIMRTTASQLRLHCISAPEATAAAVDVAANASMAVVGMLATDDEVTP